MTPEQWALIRHFNPSEFASPDAPDSGAKMDFAFVLKLDRLRHACGFPIKVRSGFRTPAHNALVGGVDSSAHEDGKAADLQAESSTARFRIISEAVKLGFQRIGIGQTFVHLDDDDKKPQQVAWLYGNNRN